MPRRNLKVLFVSAEAAPFSRVGGLASVSYFLPRALLKMGIDVRIFTPKYGTIPEAKFPMKMVVDGMRVPTGEPEDSTNPKHLVCNVKAYAEVKKTEPTVYFLENMEYYEKRANVYGYSDDHIRFGLLSRGVLEFIKKEFFVPDVLHVNDWHTAYSLDYLRKIYKDDPVLKKIATLQSVHNLFQGLFDFEHASQMDFDDGKSQLAPFFSDQFIKQNALKRGLIYADVINTVSETYAHDIMKEEYGWGLEKLFKELRGKSFGVLNGLDYTEFNPATDKLIKKNYSAGNLKNRAEDKLDLQKEFDLKPDPEAPILALYGRLDDQKGIDLITETIGFILDEFPVQFVVLGQPYKDEYRKFFEELEKKYPGRVGAHLMYDPMLPRKIIAGADIVLMPSKYEPGGIVAMEAMRYGCVPLVRATGGLNDSVAEFDPAKNAGTGFKFNSYNGMAFLAAVARTLESYKNKPAWQKLIKRAMETDFSWAKSAEKYLDLYSRAVEFHKEALLPNPPRAFKQIAS